MRLGLLSDTHGRADAARAAVSLLVERLKVDYLLHCGDVGSTAVIDALVGDVPAAVVWGNTDSDFRTLARYATRVGVGHDHPALRLKFDGAGPAERDVRICLTHGDDGTIVRDVVEQRQADYLFVGHTHAAADDEWNGVRVVNPGALHRAARKTVATVDLSTGEVLHHDVAL